MTERTETIETDLGTLAVFDAEVLRHRVRGKDDWWRHTPLHELDEVASGLAAILPIGQEGTYRVRLRRGELTEEEAGLARGSVAGLGVEVRSGELFWGAGERLPGDGRGDRLSAIPGTGATTELEPGEYSLEVHALEWRHDDAYYDEDNEVLPTAPADFVLLVRPRGELAVPAPVPSLLDLLPKREATASSRVPAHVRRRRPASPEPRRRRSRGAPAPVLDDVFAREPRERAPEEVAAFTLPRVRGALAEVLAEAEGAVDDPLGVEALLLRPRDRGLMAHDVPVDGLLKKTTRVRDQLRVLEAKVNASKGLDLFDKGELQVPITRCYQAIEALLALVAQGGAGADGS